MPRFNFFRSRESGKKIPEQPIYHDVSGGERKVSSDSELEYESKEVELHGEELKVVYRDKPIRIRLGSKTLKIVDVSKYPRYQERGINYVLVDPEEFNLENSGFNNSIPIHDNLAIEIGRRNPGNFILPQTVSERHARIELKKNVFCITDLNSTNNTFVTFRQPKDFFVESVEKAEKVPKRQRDIEDFKKYIERNEEKISKACLNREMLGALENLIYYDFYSSDVDSPVYNENDPGLVTLQGEYQVAIKSAIERLEEVSRREKKLYLSEAFNYWLFADTYNGVLDAESRGRIFFNLKPEVAVQFFIAATEIISAAGLRSRIKIPLHATAYNCNRFDKCTLYFDAADEKKILPLVNDLYRSYRNDFVDDLPRFSASLRGRDGRRMRGVAFAEDPPFSNDSFGGLRAKVLERVYLFSLQKRKSVYDKKFNFEKYFRIACRQYGVDADNPAFNLTRWRNKFSEIRRFIIN